MKALTVVLALAGSIGSFAVARRLLDRPAYEEGAAPPRPGPPPTTSRAASAVQAQAALRALAQAARDRVPEGPRWVDVPEQLSPLQDLVVNERDPDVQRTASRIRAALTNRA
jgi:hypothetical protein